MKIIFKMLQCKRDNNQNVLHAMKNLLATIRWNCTMNRNGGVSWHFSSSFYIMHCQFVIAEQVLSCDETLPMWHSLKLNSSLSTTDDDTYSRFCCRFINQISNLWDEFFPFISKSSLICVNALNHAQCHIIFVSLLHVSFSSSSFSSLSSCQVLPAGKQATESQSMKF